jgi:ubiquinone/menaquinone biosynthesis C-methylase UbiE
MATPIDPQGEHPSTYIVQDSSNQNELARVRIQGEMVTAGMGGPLPEQSDPATFRQVLDVGCGAGDWLIELAATYSTMTRLVGVDVSAKMITYARAQAEAHHSGERVEFQVMDALRMLEFPSATFDLVNIRFGSSFLRQWDWPKLLQEFRRVSRPGGVIRITEGEVVQESSSPTMLRLLQIFLQATRRAGHTFSPESNGVTKELACVLARHGFQHVQTRAHVLEYRSGTPEWQLYYDDTSRAIHTFLPFLRKWASVPDNYEELCQQALSEMRQPDFVANWSLLTVWGTTPQRRVSGTG